MSAPRRPRPFRSAVLRGLGVLLPPLLTIVILVWIWQTVKADLLEPVLTAMRNLFSIELSDAIVVPIFLIVFVAVMYLLGRFFAAGVGRVIWEDFENAITRLPVVRSVYNAAKQVTDYMFTEKELEFKRVIAFEHPSRGQWQIGFVASEGLREVRELAGEPVLAVLVHVNPVPVSGYVRIVPKSQVLDLDMTVDQAVHYIISFGVVLPPQQIAVRQGSGVRGQISVSRVEPGSGE
jgi:uncharacterized membrane protein